MALAALHNNDKHIYVMVIGKVVKGGEYYYPYPPYHSILLIQ